MTHGRLGHRVLGALLTLALARGAAADDAATLRKVEAALQPGVVGFAEPGAADVALAPADVEAVRRRLWALYRDEQRRDPARLREHRDRVIGQADIRMRYVARTKGEAPPTGRSLYIALHGGGGAPARVNDGQWRHMQVYYLPCVKEGIYVAPRAVANTWNLHSVGGSYRMYDRLIENMLLFEGVDPNRVYLLGYSAGGDGVYQIAARMPDRWAAASMSAGHHNGVSPVNLHSLPMLLQVGEQDAAYKRNQVTVAYASKLAKLRTAYPGGYAHQVNVHFGKAHGIRDNDPSGSRHAVMAKPDAWLSGSDWTTVTRDTSAVNWLRGKTRSALPERVVWHLKTGAARGGAAGLWPRARRTRQQYWLSIGDRDPKSLGTDTVIARLDRPANTIHVEQVGSYLELLLTGRMLDLARPVIVRIGEQRLSVRVRPSLRAMVTTLLERGDPTHVFEARVALSRDGTRWRVEPAPSRRAREDR